MSLIKNKRYTWAQILEETGADGTRPYYLPHQGTQVVAACVTMNLNPEAPRIILAGNGPEISTFADHYCVQGGPIPVCVKSGEKEWLCCGDFRLSRASNDPAEIQTHAALAERADVYKVLFMEEISR
jgi:hypothetical protein